ncbi:MAG: exopolysaccharide biosynthesis protein [Steroidobacteraceae bacterium]
MRSIQFRNAEVRLSEALAAARDSVAGAHVTLRELLDLIGEQGLLVFCAVLAMPFLIPVSLPFTSTALGLPMLLVGIAVTLDRVPWLPNRILDYALPGATVQRVLDRAARTASRFEHLVRPRLLGLTASPAANGLNGVALVIAVLLLMAPLPFVPLVNTLPAVAVILLSLGMAERDGVVILVGYVVALLSLVYVAAVLWLATTAGRNAGDIVDLLKEFASRIAGT